MALFVAMAPTELSPVAIGCLNVNLTHGHVHRAQFILVTT